ncbi:MAG: hypothetical protein AB2687_22745 [Candidatus Thiodiazotropha taylori]
MAGFLPYSEYTPSPSTWLGELPKHWQTSRVKFLFQILKRICGVLGHDVLSITQKGIKKKDTESGEGQLSSDYSKYQIVQPGDFAMNHMDLLTGFVDISPIAGVTSPDYRVFGLIRTGYCDRYYLYLWQMGYHQQIFFHYGQGSAHLGRWRLPAEAFKNLIFPVPPQTEQIKIAHFLDNETSRIDRLIEKQQQLIMLLREKRQAVISHSITKGIDSSVPMKDSGVEWFGEVPQHWQVLRNKHVFRLLNGFAFKGEHFRKDQAEAPLLVTPGNFLPEGGLYFSEKNSNYFIGEYSARYELNVRDLLMVLTDLSYKKLILGGTAFVSRNGLLLNQRIAKIVIEERMADRVDVDFLSQVLNSNPVRDQLKLTASGATVFHSSPEKVGNCWVVVPPLKEQKNIVKELVRQTEHIKNTITSAEKAIRLLQERRIALISAAVTGKIDVRNHPSAQPANKEVA